MPELPEVETVRRQLNRELIGREVVGVVFDAPKMVRPESELFINGVVGTRISTINRRAKMLFIGLSNKNWIAVHLKLNGRLFLRSQKDKPDQYTHVLLKFNDDSELRFTDSRKFGFMELIDDQTRNEIFKSKYGPEPLDDLSEELFQKIVSGSKKRIKDILMDQSKIAGVGNIYANDALWMAKIHPETAGNKLTSEEISGLLSALESVLKEALEDGGASDQWYRQIHGEKGHYQEHFKVYGKNGESCSRHPGTEIEYLKVSQRGSFVCSKCQIKK